MSEPTSSHLPPARHGYSRAALGRRLGWAALLLVFAGAFIAVVVVAERSPPSPRETPQERRMAELAFLVLAAPCVMFAIVSVLRIGGEHDVEAIATSDGLTYRPPRSRGDAVELRWEAVDSFTQDVRVVDYHGIPIRTIARYVLRLTNGQAVVLDGTLDRVALLANRVAAETRARMQPRMRAAIVGGATVVFGPLSLAREGVNDRGRLLSWDRFGGIEVDRYGAIVVRERGAGGHWARVAVAAVPNAHVLLPLANELAGPKEA